VEWTEVNCPRCNSLQAFIPRERKTKNNAFETYIKCYMCKWESVLDVTTDVKIAAQRRRKRNVLNSRNKAKKQKGKRNT
jgi:hypothetical protein